MALGLGGGLAGGILPRVGGSLTAGVGLLLPRVRADLEGLWLTRRRASLVDQGAGGDLRVGAVRPLVCRRFGGPIWTAPICGGLELGVLVGHGFGVTAPRTQRHLWLGGLASAGGSWSARPWLAVRLRAELVVSPLRREFTVLDRSLFTTRPVGGRLHLGIEFRLP
ncbi:MAG: hypothetical protein KDK70_25515 [Myxococcales bacterium]|nr:hypothetical protein [Myxococcales bacterium]